MPQIKVFPEFKWTKEHGSQGWLLGGCYDAAVGCYACCWLDSNGPGGLQHVARLVHGMLWGGRMPAGCCIECNGLEPGGSPLPRAENHVGAYLSKVRVLICCLLESAEKLERKLGCLLKTKVS